MKRQKLKVRSDYSEKMRGSKVGSLKNTRINGREDSKPQNHKGNNSFVIREVPIQRMDRGAECATNNNASSELEELSKGKSFSDAKKVMMDYDAPELVVFLQEDREVSTTGKCMIEDCELESNSESYEETTEETVSSVSNGSDKESGSRKLMMMVEGDHPTKSEIVEEVIDEEEEEEDFPRLFSNWQNIDSFLQRVSSRMEFPHCEHCQQFPETGNPRSTSLDGEGDHRESSSCAIGTSCTAPSTTTRTQSGCVSHGSSDSISSAHSFTFPILSTEWNGSPVRMAEAERTSQSRRHRWRKICFPCCT